MVCLHHYEVFLLGVFFFVVFFFSTRLFWNFRSVQHTSAKNKINYLLSASTSFLNNRFEMNTGDFYGVVLCIGESLGNGDYCDWSVDCMMGDSKLRQNNNNMNVAGSCLSKQIALNKPLIIDEESLSLLISTKKFKTSPTVWMSFSVNGQKAMALHFIIYHYLLGVQKFIVYDESKRMEVLLLPLIKQGIVIYHSAKLKTQNQCQISAVQLARAHNITFLGLLDVDEYVVLKNNASIPHMLARVSPTQSVVSLPWVYINASDSSSRDPSQPLYEVCPQLSCGELNLHVKSFVRPHAVELIVTDPHHKVPSPGTYQGLVTGHKFPSPSPFWDIPKVPNSYNLPVIYHFHYKRLDLYINKRAMGTGDSVRDTDFAGPKVWVKDYHKLVRGFKCNWELKHDIPIVFTNAKLWSSKIVLKNE